MSEVSVLSGGRLVREVPSVSKPPSDGPSNGTHSQAPAAPSVIELDPEGRAAGAGRVQMSDPKLGIRQERNVQTTGRLRIRSSQICKWGMSEVSVKRI
jgi:hypothetical protein